jgi:hypothetical protein
VCLNKEINALCIYIHRERERERERELEKKKMQGFLGKCFVARERERERERESECGTVSVCAVAVGSLTRVPVM